MNVRVGLDIDVKNGLSDGTPPKNGTEPEDCGLLGARCYEWDKPCCADKGLICKKHDPWCLRQVKKFCCMEDTEQPINQGAEGLRAGTFDMHRKRKMTNTRDMPKQSKYNHRHLRKMGNKLRGKT